MLWAPVPSEAFLRRLREQYGSEVAADSAELPRAPQPGSELLERFLEDATIPAAIFHSHALSRDFVLARDEAALEALTEADRRLPVLFFEEAGMLRQMGLEGIRALLDFRAEFGPEVDLRSVRLPGT